MYSSHTGVFNIYDYGTPDPTGGSDSSVAINAAAAAAFANGGGVVFIPPGNYGILYTIALPADVQLVGSDQSDTSITAMNNLKWVSGGAKTTVMVTNSFNVPPTQSTLQTGISVRDITFNGNATVLGQYLRTGTGSGAIIAFMMVADVTIQRCTIYNCQNHAITIDYVNNEGGPVVPGNIKILDNTIDVMATPGTSGPPAQNPTGNLSIRVTSYYNVIIRNNVIGYNPNPANWVPLWGNDGMDILRCSDVTVSGNQITLVTDGIDCDYGDRYVVTDNIVENYQGYGIRSERVTDAQEAVSHIVIAGNVVNASETSGTVSKAGIHVSAGLPQVGPHDYPTSHHWAVASNTVIGPTSQGGIICSASNGACTGNSVNLGSLYAPSIQQIGMLISGSNVTVTGNEVFDSNGTQQPTSIGIQFVSDQENLIQTISECVVTGNAVENASIAIDINSDIYAASISENNLTGNGVGIQIETGYTLSGCRIAGNLGWNPPLPSAITQPGYSTALTQNTTSYDCMVYVAGTSLTSIKVNGNAIAWPSGTVKGPIGVHVPVNGTIQVGGSGGSWYWTPE